MKKSKLLKPILNNDYEKVAYGKGVFLYTETGKEFLDGCSGAIVANIGHGVEEITETACEQMQNISFVYRTQFTSQSAEMLAEKLIEKTPGMDYVFYVNSGSEATEVACRLAIQHWQEKGKPFKQKILSRKISYHGTTFGALSISGHFQRRIRFNVLLNDTPSVVPPYCFKCPYSLTPEICGLKCAYDLEQKIKEYGSDSIAAFIAEPIIGASGAMITPPDGYYQIIREICDKYDILFITDEVMTGLGRTGEWLAIDHWDVTPDIIVLGKGMSAGYTPIAAILASEKVIAPLEDGSGVNVYGHTYSGNPLSTAISLGVINYMEKNNVIDNVKSVTPYFEKRLNQLQKKFPIIVDIRGKGLLKGLELDYTNHPDCKRENLSDVLVAEAYKVGLIIYPSSGINNSMEGEAIIVAPPLTITENELSILFDRLELAFLNSINIIQEVTHGI